MIGVRPVDVTSENQDRFYVQQFHYTPRQVTRGPRDDLEVGDQVHISTSKTLFDKGYTGYWKTDERFIIAEVKEGVPNKQYVLHDEDGEPIIGSFYREQLLKLPPPPSSAE
jgi:hypothetical protein